MTAPAAPLPLPMFPLGTVLFPGMPLPLHVFEPRYRVMMQDVLAGDGEFGVVLIERGSEVGGGDQRMGIGTVARVAEAAELTDGRWALLAVGTRRIRVTAWLPDDPYPQAEVVDLDADLDDVEDSDDAEDAAVDDAVTDAVTTATRNVRRALALLSELSSEGTVPTSFELDDGGDAVAAGWQLAALAPIGPADRYRVLTEDDLTRRLQLVAELADDAATMLAYRLSGG